MKIPMKLLLFLLITVLNSWGKSTILIGHFDSFSGSVHNGSEIVAQGLLAELKGHADVELKVCPLSTIFDKSFLELETCLKELKQSPRLVLGLGEYGCDVKIEAWGRNFDKTYGPDNEGNERNGTQIIPGAKEILGFTYPLPTMYCALSSKEREEIIVSNNPGSFVCNNLAYQFTHSYPDVSFGFIHVPSKNCWFGEKKIKKTVGVIKKMIEASLKTKERIRLPVEKDELTNLRQKTPLNSCLREFYLRLPGVDEQFPSRFSGIK